MATRNNVFKFYLSVAKQNAADKYAHGAILEAIFSQFLYMLQTLYIVKDRIWQEMVRKDSTKCDKKSCLSLQFFQPWMDHEKQLLDTAHW